MLINEALAASLSTHRKTRIFSNISDISLTASTAAPNSREAMIFFDRDCHFDKRLGGKTSEKKQDGAHEPECKHVQKATYVQMTLL